MKEWFAKMSNSFLQGVKYTFQIILLGATLAGAILLVYDFTISFFESPDLIVQELTISGNQRTSEAEIRALGNYQSGSFPGKNPCRASRPRVHFTVIGLINRDIGGSTAFLPGLEGKHNQVFVGFFYRLLKTMFIPYFSNSECSLSGRDPVYFSSKGYHSAETNQEIHRNFSIKSGLHSHSPWS